jgi:Mg2+/Co2+ transporter CorB
MILDISMVGLVFLVLLSAFFSGSETGFTSLNRHRLQHLVRRKNRAALRVKRLLHKPERLLTMILVGNTVTNIIAASVVTLLVIDGYGGQWVWLGTLILTGVILIFAEIIPKTVAVMYPEKVAFAASLPLRILLWLLYPVIIFVSWVALLWLKLFRIKTKKTLFESLTADELRGMVQQNEQLSNKHQDMLLGVLDLESMTVNDVMVSRQDLLGIDLDLEWETVVTRLRTSRRLRLLVYRGTVNHPLGFAYLPKIIDLLLKGCLNRSSFVRSLEPIHFIPEGIMLHKQLMSFQKSKVTQGLVVDEYGDVEGMVSLADILEEIIGDVTQSSSQGKEAVKLDSDGSYWLAGSCNVRDLNRTYGWELPVDGPNTLNGIILEHLETIPERKVGLRLVGYPLEVVQIKDNKIELVRFMPDLRVEDA